MPPEGLYDEFAARFPYEETEDQLNAIDAVLDDLGARAADGPARLRRCRLRQDRGGAARRLRRGDGRQAGRRRRADDAAGAPALPHLLRPLPRPAAQHRPGLALRARGRDEEGQGGACATASVDIVVGTHALLGKAITFKDLGLIIVDEEQHFGVVPQGAPEGAARRGPRPDAVGDADPAHPAARAHRRARAVAHHDAAGRPARGAHLRDAVRSAAHPRGAAARALPRRAGLLRRAAHRGHRRGQGLPRPGGAGGEGGGRARPDGGGPARGRDDGLLRGQVRHPALDHDRRIGPRHPDRQHAHRAPGRHVRPGAALPAARPRRALEDPRLRAVHGAGEQAR